MHMLLAPPCLWTPAISVGMNVFIPQVEDSLVSTEFHGHLSWQWSVI